MSNTFQMEPMKVYRREWLARLMGTDDRTMRAKIREQRRAGVPIMALPDGGYKLAETTEEKTQLLNMYRKRALDELTTYSKLCKSMQLEGQIHMDELIDRLREANSE